MAGGRGEYSDGDQKVTKEAGERPPACCTDDLERVRETCVRQWTQRGMMMMNYEGDADGDERTCPFLSFLSLRAHRFLSYPRSSP